MFYHRKSGWCVKAYKNGEEEYTPWTIDKDEALHECLAVFYKRHPNSNIQVLIKKDQEKAIGKHLEALANPENTQEKSAKKRKTASPKKNKATSDIRVVVPTTEDEEDLSKCGKCGHEVGPVHKCDICRHNMHTWCGRPLGEEGYGQFIRCPKCGATPV